MKNDIVVRELHNFRGRFHSVCLRARLIEELMEQVPDSITFSVGYFEGAHHRKAWIISQEDLHAMYNKYSTGPITLWCDGRVEEDGEAVGGRVKRKREEPSSRRQEKENKVHNVYQDLKKRHGDSFSTPQLRLWARMVTANLHEDLDTPPTIPAFRSAPKRPRQSESFSDALSGAAVAIVKALGGETSTKCCDSPTSVYSPSKSMELRMKNFEQLRYLQQLFGDGVVTQEEYLEQKQSILCALKKL